MRLDELDPADRRAVQRGKVAVGVSGRRRVPDSPARPSGRPAPGRWLCIRCGDTFRAYAPAERHVDEAHRAGRIEVDVAREDR